MNNKRTAVERAAFSIPDAGHYIGVSRSTIYRMLNERVLTAVRIGYRRVILRAELDALLAAGTAAANDNTVISGGNEGGAS